jgi:hypothetical protein
MASAMAQAGGLAGLGELGTEMGRQRRDDTPWDLWRDSIFTQTHVPVDQLIPQIVD